MTMYSDLVAFLGGAAGIALLAVMAFGPLLLDLPAPRPRRAASGSAAGSAAGSAQHSGTTLTIVSATPAQPSAARVDIPAQRAAETVGVRA